MLTGRNELLDVSLFVFHSHFPKPFPERLPHNFHPHDIGRAVGNAKPIEVPQSIAQINTV